MTDQDRMLELKRQGFFCSQILMILALELQRRENAPLVRASHGLAGGLGFTGETCGALTGGAPREHPPHETEVDRMSAPSKRGYDGASEAAPRQR